MLLRNAHDIVCKTRQCNDLFQRWNWIHTRFRLIAKYVLTRNWHWTNSDDQPSLFIEIECKNKCIDTFVTEEHINKHTGNTGCQVFKCGLQNWKDFCLRINIHKGNYWILWIGVVMSCQKLGIILVIKLIEKWFNDFWCRKLTLKVKFWHFLTPSHRINSLNSKISVGYVDF